MRFASFVARSVLGLALLAAPAPGFATPFAGTLSKGIAGEAAGNSSLVLVQYHHRHGGGHYRGGGYRGGYRGGGYYGGGDDGGAIAAGAIFGLALGAIIAGQAQQQRSVGYCAQRFRSYDPGSGTYLGYDGLRHSCP